MIYPKNRSLHEVHSLFEGNCDNAWFPLTFCRGFYRKKADFWTEYNMSNKSLVKIHTIDRYYAALYANPDKREDLFALYAFDAEISRICKKSQDSMPSEIRLQWWREVLTGERAGEANGHALACDIIRLIETYHLPIAVFEAYLDAKIFELYHDPFPDSVALETWCGETSSAFLQMTALILDSQSASLCVDAAGHGGVVYALAHIVQNLPETRAKGHCFVPMDMLNACGLDRAEFIELKNSSHLKNASDVLCELGMSHFDKYHTVFKALPASVKPAFLPISVAHKILRRALKKSQNPALSSVRLSDLHIFYQIVKAAF
jgi:15-cis-phytoene synthase